MRRRSVTVIEHIEEPDYGMKILVKPLDGKSFYIEADERQQLGAFFEKTQNFRIFDPKTRKMELNTLVVLSRIGDKFLYIGTDIPLTTKFADLSSPEWITFHEIRETEKIHTMGVALRYFSDGEEFPPFENKKDLINKLPILQGIEKHIEFHISNEYDRKKDKKKKC